MALIVTVSGSPSSTSRTLLLARHLTARLDAQGWETALINVRDLPAEDLLWANGHAPRIRDAAALLARADGVIIATPVYKAAYAGALKSFLDLLPQYALVGKTVLPIATGGSLAHVLSIDYALRPVLASLGARHVTGGYFFLDQQLVRSGDPSGERLYIDPVAVERFEPIFSDFQNAVASTLTGAVQIFPREQPGREGLMIERHEPTATASPG
jgi:FMN reductase